MSKVIAVTGKGGTGKTTAAALIIRWLKAHARGPILALDADPDANLATRAGHSRREDHRRPARGRFGRSSCLSA